MKMTMKKAPMGWNSYDYYDTTVTEEQVKANADYMAANLKDCGWSMWWWISSGTRKTPGAAEANSSTFPLATWRWTDTAGTSLP